MPVPTYRENDRQECRSRLIAKTTGRSAGSYLPGKRSGGMPIPTVSPGMATRQAGCGRRVSYVVLLEIREIQAWTSVHALEFGL